MSAADLGAVFHDHDHPVYRTDLVVANGERGSDLADRLGLRPLEVSEVVELDSAVEDRPDMLQALQDLTEDGAISFFDPGRGFPFELIENNPVLSPVFAGFFLPHFGFGPATPPNALGPGFVPAPPSGAWNIPTDTPRHVAVVDTGIFEEQTNGAGAFPNRIAMASANGYDIEQPGEFVGGPNKVSGHGTFVATVIANKHPDLRVVVAKMGPANPLRFTSSAPNPPVHRFSDELEFAAALSRLASRNRTYSALNLSLGFYVPTGGVATVAENALNLWMTRQQAQSGAESRVVAAAGNIDPFHAGSGAAWPASRPDVIGVESSDVAQNPSTFTMTDPSYWVAVGEDVEGIRRRGGRWSRWSGTSFAAPKVAAWRALDQGSNAAVRLANGKPFVPD